MIVWCIFYLPDTYYVIPAGMPDAKIGEWKVGPRTEFFDALYKAYPQINLIAEDLGDLRPEVLELRDDLFRNMFKNKTLNINIINTMKIK